MTEQEYVPPPRMVRVYWRPPVECVLGQIDLFSGPSRVRIWETSTGMYSARMGLNFSYDRQTWSQIMELVELFLEGDS